VTGNNRKVSSEDVSFGGFRNTLGSHWLVAVCHQRPLCHCGQWSCLLSARRLEGAKPSHVTPPWIELPLPLTEQHTHSQRYCCHVIYSTRWSLKLQPRCMSQPSMGLISSLDPTPPNHQTANKPWLGAVIDHSGCLRVSAPAIKECLALLKPLALM
jgi:hypothetical protein